MTPIEASNYKISVMSPSDLETAVCWAKNEGWNPGIHDASAFYQADATGFLAGKYNGQIIATISAVKYGADFGFIGLYIVEKNFRGRGFGFKIWQEAISCLANRNIGLDGVLAQQENYKKSGFKLAHRNIRYSGKSIAHQPSNRAIATENIDLGKLLKYDSQFFPEDRVEFLKNWISPQNSNTLAIVEDSQILGYGSIRPCHQGFKIGPLNANNPDVAEELFFALTASIPDGSEIFLDVPEPNKNAIQLAEKSGMTAVFETARMYTKKFPNLSLNKIFGITTFELG
jgi:GNAT superfamily N-acetyltransferase